jgi:hypothetical protein
MMPTRCVFAMRCTCSRVFSTSRGHTNVAVRAPAGHIEAMLSTRGCVVAAVPLDGHNPRRPGERDAWAHDELACTRPNHLGQSLAAHSLLNRLDKHPKGCIFGRAIWADDRYGAVLPT